MKIEKWIVAHFSPTGGTKKVADAIAAGFNTPVVEMDLTKTDSVVYWDLSFEGYWFRIFYPKTVTILTG